MSIRDDVGQAMRIGAKTIEASCSEENLECLESLIKKIIDALKTGGTVLLCGNGGSAAQAQHIAAEFVGRFKRERRALASISLTTDTSVLTSLANDFGYDTVFARQVESVGRSGDVLIALSTSGNSVNVLKAVETAQKIGLATAALTGQSGGRLAEIVPLTFRAPSNDTAHIQEAHITALHAVCDAVEASFSS